MLPGFTAAPQINAAGLAVPPPPANSELVSTYLQENKIDARAAASFRALSEEVQQKVIQEGPVTGTNPSAVLTARVKKIEAKLQAKGGGSASSTAPAAEKATE